MRFVPVTGIALFALCSAAEAQTPLTWFERDLLDPRSRFGLADDALRGRLVLFGGSTLQGDTWEWDGQAWTKRVPEVSPPGRLSPGMVWAGARERTILFGGSDGSAELADTWQYDGATWTSLSVSGPPARSAPMMAYDVARRRVVLFGGSAGGQSLGDTWEFDGTTWLQLTPAQSPPGQSDAAIAYDAARQRVTLFGTAVGGAAGTWTWDGTTWTDVTPAASPRRSGGQRMAYHPPSQRVVLFGGNASPGLGNQTWEWDGTGWQQRVADAPANAYHGMAFASASGELILFGGDNGLADTWAWDGSRWRQRPSPTGIPAMVDPAIAYDSARDRLVVFGDGGGRNFKSTWEWDGITWARRTNRGAYGPYAPLPSGGHRMVYDSTRGRMIVYGGYRRQPSAWSNDTYEWDGRLWVYANTESRPTVGTQLGMVYDVARQRVVVFGGSLTTNATWEFDGGDWRQSTPPGSPSPRMNPAMAYDVARQRTVLFGGEDASGVLLDTWEWNGTTWRSLAPAQSPGVGGTMTYDVARQRVVLLEATSTDPRTWEWDGVTWRTFGAAAPRSSDLLAYDSAANELVLLANTRPRPATLWAQKATTPASAELYGATCAGASGGARLSAFGRPVSGSRRFALDVAGAPPLAPVVFVLSAGAASVPFGPCTVLVDLGAALPIPTAARAGGFASIRIPIPAGPQWIGAPAFSQAVVLDAGAALGFTLTRGLALVLGE